MTGGSVEGPGEARKRAESLLNEPEKPRYWVMEATELARDVLFLADRVEAAERVVEAARKALPYLNPEERFGLAAQNELRAALAALSSPPPTEP